MKELKKFRWYWAWDDEKEEAWLREMARQGWHLKSAGFIYTLEAGEPRDMAYRLDFFTDPKNTASYLQLFQDAGWEYVGAFGSWQYFRKPVQDGEAPEIFTDNESKIKKYQRVLILLVVFMPIFSMMTRNLNEETFPFLQAMGFVSFFFLLFFIFAILMLLRRISQLKQR